MEKIHQKRAQKTDSSYRTRGGLVPDGGGPIQIKVVLEDGRRRVELKILAVTLQIQTVKNKTQKIIKPTSEGLTT